MRFTLLLLAASITAAAQTPAPTSQPPTLTGPITYTCGAAPKNLKQGEIPLTPATLVTDKAAGWDLNSVPVIANGICSAQHADGKSQPFYLFFPVPEGNYRITLTLGGKDASVVTVRAEARRLMIEKLPIAAGKTVTRTIDVNVRIPEFTKPDGTPGRVRLKPREIGNLDWDPRLTLEFNGDHPAFHSLTIQPITNEPVIYLAGDSTMVDQDVEPWASWGQMLPRFFSPGIVVANHAESGESSASFISEQRMAKIMSLIKPGDWFFVQFAHNDQKLGPAFPDRYRQIMTGFVYQVRAKGATPVIVTAMNRDMWDESDTHIRDTLAPYPQISREVAAATGTALIDLNAMSKTMFEAMGHAGADKAFMHFAANTFPGQEAAINDNTHFNSYGAYELARSIVQGIRDDKLPLAKFLDPSVPAFDPAKPDPFVTFSLPFTPMQKKEDTTKVPQT
jgi:lysophospholipase L1-like esterase